MPAERAATSDRERRAPRVLLLDLDGTLVDTAPDMVRVLNRLCAELDVAPVDYTAARNRISNGVAALLELALGAHDPGRGAALRERYLELYRLDLARESVLFPGIEALLQSHERRGLPWGVVTNKPAHLSEPLLAALGLAGRAACIVSGDTTAQPKPHPAPLLHASRLLGYPPAECLYAGDAQIDVRAGRAAGMFTVVAAYGYIDDPGRIAAWAPDAVISHPGELLGLLGGEACRA